VRRVDGCNKCFQTALCQARAPGRRNGRLADAALAKKKVGFQPDLLIDVERPQRLGKHIIETSASPGHDRNLPGHVREDSQDNARRRGRYA